MTTIDLHLPTSWNGCTTADLEAIAAAIIQEQQRTDRYHPFDWSRVKLNVVLAINSLTPDPSPKGEGSGQTSALRPQTADIGASGDEYLVRRPQDRAPWPITTGQLVALTERLAFLDDPKANRTIFAFPYPKLTFNVPRNATLSKRERSPFNVQRSTFNVQRSMFNVHRSTFTVLGPAPLLDGYTWQEYRYLTDWMQEYMRCTNASQDATEPMCQFLAVLFKPAPDAQPTFNVQCSMFEGFSPIKWQVILFWWSSLMGLLQQKFPRVFKPQTVGRGRQQKKNETPWDFYNRVTAMLADEYKSSEADQQNETYGVTLQKLQNMAERAAELERLKNKK